MHWLTFSKRWQYITKLANVSQENQQAQAQTPKGGCCYVCQRRLWESSHSIWDGRRVSETRWYQV